MFLQKITRKHAILLLSIFAAIAVVLIYFYTNAGGHGDADKWINEVNCPTVSVNTSNSTLKLVHIVLRHGVRTPVTTYPNDPYLNDSFQPTGWGQVTNKGKAELYHIGEWLQRRYGKFMEPHYSPDYVYVQSTATGRTLMSTSTVLASFFAPRGTDMEWNPELNWQPIPIFSEPLEEDSLLLVLKPCPRYFEAREEVYQLPMVKAELAKEEALFQNLTELTGAPIKTAEDVNSLYNTLLAEQEFGYTLPAWTKDYFPEKMKFLAERSLIYNVYTREMQKIKGGPFLKKTFAEMLEKRSGKLKPSNRKLFIYGAHDWTVGTLLASLNLWKGQLLRFAVTLIFELHQNQQTGEYYVEIYLRNTEDGCAELLTVPKCEAQCPLDRLIELSADVIPNDTFEERCKAKNPNYVEPAKRSVEHNPTKL